MVGPSAERRCLLNPKKVGKIKKFFGVNTVSNYAVFSRR